MAEERFQTTDRVEAERCLFGWLRGTMILAAFGVYEPAQWSRSKLNEFEQE